MNLTQRKRTTRSLRLLVISLSIAAWCYPLHAGLCDDPPALPFSIEYTSPTLTAPTLLMPEPDAECLDIESNLFSWAEVAGATGYNLDAERIEIFPFDPGTPDCHINVIVSGTSFLIPERTLSPGVYRWRVRALGEDGIGPSSMDRNLFVKTLCLAEAHLSWSLSVTVPSLGVPQLLFPEHQGSVFVGMGATLSWSEVADATGYNFEVKTIGCLINRVVTEPFFQIPPDVLFEQGYRWSVRALGRGGIGPKAEERVFNVFRHTPTPTSTASPTPTPDIDFSGDNTIDSNDTFLILAEWYVQGAAHNLVGDSRFTEEDLIAYIQAWKRRDYIAPTPILPPPILLEPEDGSEIPRDEILGIGGGKLASFAVGEGVLFRWLPVANADGYQILFNGPSGGTLGEYPLPGTQYGSEVWVTLPITTLSADLGIYRWQVRSVSSALEIDRRFGPFGTPLSFQVTNPTVTPTPTIAIQRSADLNQDGWITAEDLFAFAASWRISSGSAGYLEEADLDRSGEVEQNDLHRFLRSQEQRLEEAVPAPNLLWPENGAFFTTDGLLDENYFRWIFKSVPGAALYRYKVLGPPPFRLTEGIIQDAGKQEYSLVKDGKFSPGYAGTWTWSIQAVASTGRVSPESEVRSFTVAWPTRPFYALEEPTATPTPTDF